MKTQNKKFTGLLQLKLLALMFATLFAVQDSVKAQEDEIEKSVSEPAIWTLQANSYSRYLEMKKSDAKKLFKAYLTFREDVDHENFNRALKSILESDQQDNAFLVLGSLNSRWDSYLEILSGYDLPKADLEAASDTVCTYMIKYLEARKEAEMAETRFSGRTATSLKEGLDSGLKPILSDEQMADWGVQTARKKKQ